MPNFAPDQLQSEKPTARRSVLKMLLWGFGSGLIAGGAVEVMSILVGRNFHIVVPNSIYRCSQPTANQLESLIERYRIRTVINLRGCCAPFPWYLNECRVAQRNGVSQEDICFSAGRLPPSNEVRRLVDILEHSEYPLLLHCYHGADRTGLASGIAKLLKTDSSLEEARKQLSPLYGHLPLGRTGNLDRFFDLYSNWLTKRGEIHTKMLFRQWAANDYCGGECRASLEILNQGSGAVDVVLGKPFTLQVRSYNSSASPWKLRAANNAGIHCCAIVNDANGQCASVSKSGLYDAEVPAGGHVNLTLAMPPIWQKGKYRLIVDMIDEQQGFFFQAGSEPLERELVVRE
jgi:hypothetical protein